jgi:hypothetical protein
MCCGSAQPTMVTDENTSKEPDMTPRIRASRMITIVRRGVADMSYAQRRAFENQTGIAVAHRSRAIACTAAELEALYARGERPSRQSGEPARGNA